MEDIRGLRVPFLSVGWNRSQAICFLALYPWYPQAVPDDARVWIRLRLQHDSSSVQPSYLAVHPGLPHST